MKLKQLYNEIKLIKKVTVEEVDVLYEKILKKIYNGNHSLIIEDLVELAQNNIENFLISCGWGNLKFKDLPLSKLSIMYNGLKQIQKKHNIK